MITTFIAFYRVFCRNMPAITSAIAPLGVRNMKILDRDKFKREVTVQAITVLRDKIRPVIAVLKPFLLKLEKFNPVQDYPSDMEANPMKIILLHPDKVNSWSDLPSVVRSSLNDNNVTENSLKTKNIVLTYDNWKVEQILNAVLDDESVTGYSQIGHIIHLNLRDQVLEYKHLIGQVFLDKYKVCRTVIHKQKGIDNTYRTFSMEVLAGEEDFFAQVRVNGYRFEFDFSKVYWNPRLESEHLRIVSALKPTDVLFDVFCGVGPFAIPAAKREVTVYANDLNPDSIKWLTHNAKLNKVKNNLHIFNDDGANFISNNFKEYLKDICECKIVAKGEIHVTMNLPSMAVEFLQYFIGILSGVDISKLECEIIIHVYCFTTIEEPEKVATDLVKENIKYDISEHIKTVFNVRRVSPKKDMMRVSFKLPHEVLLGNVESAEPPAKKVCKSSD